MEELLTVDFTKKSIEIGKKPIDLSVLYLGNSTDPVLWKDKHYRCPWELIPEKDMKGMNFFFTLNIDPSIDGYENTKKYQIPKVLMFMKNMQMDKIISKYVIIYEWGKQGKSYGKLHFHGFIKTIKRNEFEDQVCKEFNRQTNARHRTIQTSPNKDVATRQRRINYLKKETQNKIKCLHWN